MSGLVVYALCLAGAMTGIAFCAAYLIVEVVKAVF